MTAEYEAEIVSPTKCRVLLPRTAVLMLNPVSCLTNVHRFSHKLESIFEDFKASNRYSMNVSLRDAIDDISIIGWLAPFTLLIHGTSEDMDTIQQAWVGRMLKPPRNFVIKDFGEITTLNMTQVSQSQFISISETLVQIIGNLNENQISATLECVMNRLSTNFDSIIIPPVSAIIQSLELLIKETKLFVINGVFYVAKPKLQNISGSSTTSEKYSIDGTPHTHGEAEKDSALSHSKVSNFMKSDEKSEKMQRSRTLDEEKREQSRKMVRKVKVRSKKNSYNKLMTFNTSKKDSPDKRLTIFEKLSRLFRHFSSQEESEHDGDDSLPGHINEEHPLLKAPRKKCSSQRESLEKDRKTKKQKKAGMKNKKPQKYASSKPSNASHEPHSRYFDKGSSSDSSSCDTCISQRRRSYSSLDIIRNKSPVKKSQPASDSETFMCRRRQNSLLNFSTSCSDTSYFTDQLSKDDFYSASKTCVKCEPPSYSDVIARHRPHEYAFYSTQAVCGDLENSTPFLYVQQHEKLRGNNSYEESPTTPHKHDTFESKDKQSKNLQFIGVL